MNAYRILLIEDDPDGRQSVTEAILEGGFEVASAASGSEGVALFANGAFDVVLTDLRMPGKSGLEVLANILLFVPFGLYLGLLAPTWRWWKPTAAFVVASLVLEATQHLLSTGSFDTTDIIVNTAGGLAGLGLFAMARRRLQTRTAVGMTSVPNAS